MELEPEALQDYIKQCAYACSILALVLNLFAFYLVVKYSTAEMGYYRYSILMILVTATLFDVTVTLVVRVEVLFPHIACAFAEYLYLGFEEEGSMIFAVLAMEMGFMVYALVSGFIYRAYVLMNERQRVAMRRFTIGLFWVCLALGLSFCTLAVRSHLSGEELQRYLKHFPDLATQVARRPFAIADFDKSLTAVGALVLAVSYFALLVLIGWLCLVYISLYLYKARRKMSQRSWQHHMMYLKALSAHSAAPVCLILLPLVLVLYAIVKQDKNSKIMVDLAFLGFSIHASVNVLILILFVAPYRRAVLALLRAALTCSKPAVTASRSAEYLEASTQQQQQPPASDDSKF